MSYRWSSKNAEDFPGDIGKCVYASRLIGADPDLVLHGGGNTSVKLIHQDLTGQEIPALYVKGSGWDLGSIQAEGFTPLRMTRLLELLQLDTLSDLEMMSELLSARLDPYAPAPSVESLLHAWIPHRFVLHSHADVIVTLTNLADGAQMVREVFGEEVVIIPYVMPGFDLAKEVAELCPDRDYGQRIGLVLLNHGLFTFAETAETAYRHHINIIQRAEDWLAQHAPFPNPETPNPPPLPPVSSTELAGFRKRLSEIAGKPMIVTRHNDPVSEAFVRREDLADLANRGPLTPDHVIRTKRVPLVGRDLDGYASDYRTYFQEHRHRARTDIQMLDPAPRVVADPEWGVLTAGENAKATGIAADIYQHTMPVLMRAEDKLGGYQALSPADIFDCEYWELEQAKLKRSGKPPPLTGMVAVVTGAASGIGRACAEVLQEQGAAVAGWDLDQEIGSIFSGPNWLGQMVDVTDRTGQQRALTGVAERFGGVDILVTAAGVFGQSQPIASRTRDDWDKVYRVNTESIADLLALAHPLLALSPVGGRVVLIGSKNVPAPGRGAGAYSVSKAALTQLGRVAALEWAEDGIRVNAVHPDGVFDTGLWTEEVLAERARAYGLSVEEYKTRNLLSCEITSRDVARAVLALCDDTFSATTGAQIPVDGGSDRVI